MCTKAARSLRWVNVFFFIARVEDVKANKQFFDFLEFKMVGKQRFLFCFDNKTFCLLTYSITFRQFS